MANFLYRGLTEEEKKEVERINREYHIEKALAEGAAQGRNDAKLDAVDRLIADGLYDKARACEVLGVSLEDYDAHAD